MQAPKSLKFPPTLQAVRIDGVLPSICSNEQIGITALRLEAAAEQVKNPILKDKIGKIAFMVEGNSLVDSFRLIAIYPFLA